MYQGRKRMFKTAALLALLTLVPVDLPAATESPVLVEEVGRLGERQDTIYKIVDLSTKTVCFIIQPHKHRDATSTTISCAPIHVEDKKLNAAERIKWEPP